MNIDQVLRAKPSRAFDFEVHTKVMGWREVDPAPGLGTIRVFFQKGHGTMTESHVPHYSEDETSAFRALKKITESFDRPAGCTIKRTAFGWSCTIHHGFSNSETLPLAICRALLVSVSYEETLEIESRC